MNPIRLLSSLALITGLTMFGCGGIEDTSSDEPTVPETSFTEAAIHGGHGGRHGDDDDFDVEWSCRASPIGGGPVFFGTSHPDLSAAMDYAVAECERQMNEDCTQQGCSFRRGWD